MEPGFNLTLPGNLCHAARRITPLLHVAAGRRASVLREDGSGLRSDALCSGVMDGS
jgi:hypothetical protein